MSLPGAVVAGAWGRRPSAGWAGARSGGVAVLSAPSSPGGSSGSATHVGVDRWHPGVELAAVGREERDEAVSVAGDVPAAFVDEVMVPPAQPDQVVGLGRSAVDPVDHVVEVADLAVAA